MSPMMSPSIASGTLISTSAHGSSSVSPASLHASLNPIDPQIWNAMSDESTEWNLPSTSVTFTSMTG